MRGLFITIEGGDGSGKSTQLNLLKAYFENKDFEIIMTREPGGTNISEEIRKIILNTNYMEMSDMTEALLYAASRAQHVEELILPNLKKGKIVISDRFVDSSIVYQGYARGLGVEEISLINRFATKGLKPDLTIYLDVSPKEGIKRKEEQKDLDRLELEKLNFHEKVNKGYKLIAKNEPERILLIDGSRKIEEIHEIIISKVEELIKIIK